MLDPYMQYSCGYWKNASNLAEAQLHKMELLAQKLKLKPGMSILDLGCGFGGLAKYLAENYSVSVVGCTISEEQMKFGKELCKGLPVEFYLCDYREMKLTKKFDRVVSVGFMEHVGLYNYRTVYKIAEKALKPDGLFVLHTMGVNSNCSIEMNRWLHEHIFPNGWQPKLEYLVEKAEDLFIVEDIHNFGADYAPTLAQWRKNFISSWSEIKKNGLYDDRFFRIWVTYLSGSEAFLKSRSVQVYQIVYSKKGLLGGYQAPR